MVVFIDFEEDPEPPEGGKILGDWRRNGRIRERLGVVGRLERVPGTGDDVRENPNKGLAITAALGCYPIVISLASHIDLNALDSLSRSCRQIRVNLLQFRTQLLTSTLHCENENMKTNPEHTFRYRARAADWYFIDEGRSNPGVSVGRGFGKVGECARDMVGGCRRCGRIVCRNCTIKPPAPIMLSHRHRRICQPCSQAPLSNLISYPPNQISSSTVSQQNSSNVSFTSTPPTYLLRSICICATESIWLCQPCGRSIRSADQEYSSIWKWRTRYLPSLGGLGVGIGEGNRGVPCGRGGECIAAREVEQETDCDAEDARVESGSRVGTPGSFNSNSSSGGSLSSGMAPTQTHMGPGYARHEIEGIGGVVKKKLVRMVKVGACVSEWSEEKELGKFLLREVDGRARSWCGWCWRVVPGVKDLVGLEDGES